MAWSCNACLAAVEYPQFELHNADQDGRRGGLYATCPKCKHVDRACTPDSFSAATGPALTPVTAPSPAAIAPGQPGFRVMPQAPKVAPVIITGLPVASVAHAAPPDPLALIRERISYLEVETARLEGMRSELRTLQKIIKPLRKRRRASRLRAVKPLQSAAE